MSDTLAARVQQRLSELHKSPRAASLETGLSDAFVLNILNGKSRSPRSDNLAKLAVVLNTTEAWLIHGGDDPTSNVRHDVFKPELITGNSLITNDRSLPIYPAAMGGDGHVVITFDPIEYVKRPAMLEHVKDGYGVYIVGESMIPAYKPGETALVHPRLPPARDTDVVLFHTPPDADAECMIKQLNGFNDEVWHLEQFRPAKTFDEFRKEWPICHRVVGKYNRR
ncbi:S24 family peptidase [Devosia sp. 2618]|uniref:XRE family transcriptional regulator n=1 Tax=Devosia sp. 2618 TaxID=3156454 RepID=UPI003398E6E1